MSLQTKSFTTLVSEYATAVQASAAALMNFTVGSVLRAIGESTAGVALWLQGLIVALLSTVRLTTSSGADVDSWLADFGFARLPANAASGSVTFSRLTPTNQAVIPVGTTVQSSDGTLQFVVLADATNAAYSATIIAGGGFVIPAGNSGVTITVTCTTPGTSGYPDTNGNVSANTITSMVQAIPYVDRVTNPVPFTNGFAPESDTAVKARFVLWLNSLAEGTKAAVYAAIAGVQQGLRANVLENTQYNGTVQNGYFTVVVDDGTGSPPASLLTSVSNAVDAIRPLTSTFSVHAPLVVGVNVAMSVTTAAGYLHATVTAAVQDAITIYINSLSIGASLSYTKLAQIAYEASPGVVAVLPGYTVNSGTSDVTATGVIVLKSSSVAVS